MGLCGAEISPATERTEPLITHKDLKRPIEHVLGELNMLTPQLTSGLTLAKVTTVAGLCDLEVKQRMCSLDADVA